MPRTIEKIESRLKREIEELKARVSALESKGRASAPPAPVEPKAKPPLATKKDERPLFAEPAELEKPNPRGQRKG